MKVESKYNLSYTGISVPKNIQQRTPNFTGKALEFTDYLKQKRLVKFLQKLKWFDGEQGRILITALGTGAIAPLFIAWNPYVKPKEDASEEEKQNLKRTKKYTAMRQPISAALAIPIQMSLVSPIEKGLDIIFNNSKYSKFIPTYLDKSALQDDKYIERQEKKKLKQGSKLSKEEFKTKLAENVKAVKNQQISDVSKGLLENGQIRIRKGADGVVDNKSVVEALQKEIRNYASDTNLLRYDSFSGKQLEDLFKDPAATLNGLSEGKDFYAKRANTLMTHRDELRKTLKTNMPKDKNELKNYFKGLAEKADNTELKEIYQEFIKISAGDAQASRAARTIERIEKLEQLEKSWGGKFTHQKYKEHMKKDEAELMTRLRKFAEISKELKENPQSIKETIAKVAENCRFDKNDTRLNKIFHDLTTFGIDSGKLKEKICKDVVKGYKSMISSRYRFIKEIAGISLGMFITVPVTCHTLNWVYPRFMEIFFPKLCVNKTANKNGGEK